MRGGSTAIGRCTRSRAWCTRSRGTRWILCVMASVPVAIVPLRCSWHLKGMQESCSRRSLSRLPRRSCRRTLCRTSRRYPRLVRLRENDSRLTRQFNSENPPPHLLPPVPLPSPPPVDPFEAQKGLFQHWFRVPWTSLTDSRSFHSPRRWLTSPQPPRWSIDSSSNGLAERLSIYDCLIYSLIHRSL